MIQKDITPKLQEEADKNLTLILMGRPSKSIYQKQSEAILAEIFKQ